MNVSSTLPVRLVGTASPGPTTNQRPALLRRHRPKSSPSSSKGDPQNFQLSAATACHTQRSRACPTSRGFPKLPLRTIVGHGGSNWPPHPQTGQHRGSILHTFEELSSIFSFSVFPGGRYECNWGCAEHGRHDGGKIRRRQGVILEIAEAPGADVGPVTRAGVQQFEQPPSGHGKKKKVLYVCCIASDPGPRGMVRPPYSPRIHFRGLCTSRKPKPRKSLSLAVKMPGMSFSLSVAANAVSNTRLGELDAATRSRKMDKRLGLV